jgi:hypothetical protein
MHLAGAGRIEGLEANVACRENGGFHGRNLLCGKAWNGA